MRRWYEEVDVEEVAAARSRGEKDEENARQAVGCIELTGDALKRCLSGDVSYPRERVLVNRRGRFRGSFCHSAALFARTADLPDCRWYCI